MPRNQCCICFENLNMFSKKLTCGHVLHHNCYLKWVERNPTCPLCRVRIHNIPTRRENNHRPIDYFLDRELNLPFYDNVYNYDMVDLIDLQGAQLTIRDVIIFILITIISILVVLIGDNLWHTCLCDQTWDFNQTYKVEYKWWGRPYYYKRYAFCTYVC